MKCRWCGEEIPSDSQFCHICGKKVERNDEIDSNHADTDDRETLNSTVIETEKGYKQGKNKTPQIIIIAAIAVLLVAIIVLLLVFKNKTVGVTSNQGANTESRDNSVKTANEIAELSSSVLTLYVYDSNDEISASGSGFVIGNDLTLITNYHVIDQAHRVEAVSESNVVYNMKGVSYYDTDKDVAILKFETNTGLTPLDTNSLDTVNVGDSVYAIGSPQGLQNTVSNGIVSAIRMEDDLNYIQFTAPVSPGSSGGALLNDRGQAIGIVTSYIDGQNLNFAIPIDEFTIHLSETNIVSFLDVKAQNQTMGNTVQNYSSWNCSLVEDDTTIYHSYYGGSKIESIDKKTGREYPLGISGYWLSRFGDELYYIPENEYFISAYNVKTKKKTDNVLESIGYNGDEKIDRFVVTKHGFTIASMDVIKQIGFDGKQVASFNVENKLWWEFVLVDADTIASFDYPKQQLLILPLETLEPEKIDLGFEPHSLCVGEEGVIYVNDTNSKDTCMMNIYTGETEWITRKNCSVYNCFVNKDDMYFESERGTMLQTISDGTSRILSSKYSMSYFTFTEDGKFYAEGEILGDEMMDDDGYIRYYFRGNTDGSDIEVLDTKRWF